MTERSSSVQISVRINPALSLLPPLSPLFFLHACSLILPLSHFAAVPIEGSGLSFHPGIRGKSGEEGGFGVFLRRDLKFRLRSLSPLRSPLPTPFLECGEEASFPIFAPPHRNHLSYSTVGGRRRATPSNPTQPAPFFSLYPLFRHGGGAEGFFPSILEERSRNAFVSRTVRTHRQMLFYNSWEIICIFPVLNPFRRREPPGFLPPPALESLLLRISPSASAAF